MKQPKHCNQQVWLAAFALCLVLLPQVQAQGFAYTDSMANTRATHTATLLTNGMVLAAGGVAETSTNNDVISSAELFNPATATWTLTGSLDTARQDHTATLLTNGLVLVAGGFNFHAGLYGVLSSAELFNPATSTWTTISSMSTNRYTHTATLLNNGKVLVAGGYNNTKGCLSSAELFNPATGTWTLTGSLHTARQYHMATLLTNGLVLVTGGLNNLGGMLTSAELFNPATGTWTTTGSMNAFRYYHTATLLNNGMVLVAGGFGDGGSLSSSELFDPATGTWTLTGSMNSSRQSHTATLLASGMVLVTGGNHYNFGLISSAELFDPATGTWTLTGSLNTARADHTATLLNNGCVLVAGGIGTNSYTLSSSELISMVIMPGYNQISGNLLSSGEMSLSFVGFAGANYALDRSFSLSPANWIPQVTNPADANGNLIFTNSPDPTTNNFWRIRSVP
jgi:N-acetylneuraminic acid mutarotase